jgi:hypothetical protein
MSETHDESTRKPFELLAGIDGPKQLADFLRALSEDAYNDRLRWQNAPSQGDKGVIGKHGSSEWENGTIDDYLESIAAWIESFPQCYINTDTPVPTNINWRFIGEVFYVGKIYE